MDDDRTQKTLDALADLFLTGPAPGGSIAPNAGGPTLAGGGVWRPVRVPPKPATTAQPTDIEAGTTKPAAPARAAALREQLDGPAPEPLRMPARPVKLGPSIRRSRQPDTTPEPHAPPSLRLHTDAPAAVAEETADPIAPAAAVDLRVEAVLMGNLPGFGGPWLTQYAQHVARQRGPVVLLHVDDQQIEAELINPAPGTAPGNIPGNSGDADIPAEAGDDLVGLLAELAWRGPSSARTILVHLTSPAAPTQLAMLRDLSRWTVLSGADDTAVVAAYKLIKQSIDESEASSRRKIALMVMGSDEARAKAVEKKLAAAVTAILHQPLELAGWRKQMGPVHLRQLATFANPGELWPNLREFFGEIEAASPPPVTEDVARAEPQTPPAARAKVQEPDEPIDLESDLDEPADEMESAPTPSPRMTPPRPALKSKVGRPPSAPPTPPVADDVPDLASFLASVPGAVALQARCPRHPDTQLVLDQDGRLHLLRQHDSSAGDEAQLRAAVLDLIDARGWVQEHVDLLRLTQRQCRFDPATEPVLHLFTDQGRLATALAAKLGSFLKIHLLQVVHVGDASTWFCTELN